MNISGLIEFKPGRSVLYPSAPLAALGGENPGRYCLARELEWYISPLFGDLGDYSEFSAFRNHFLRATSALRLFPRTIVRDLHPSYAVSRWAAELCSRPGKYVRLVAIQHHWAHLAAVLADRGVKGPVIGIIWDGTGWGDDGRIWGGEFLAGEYRGFLRWGRLEYLPLPGGDKAVEEPWRIAFSCLFQCFGPERDNWPKTLRRRFSDARADLLAGMLSRGINCPLSSSMGRIFDATAALLGLADGRENGAGAARKLEAAARSFSGPSYPFRFSARRRPAVVDFKPMYNEIANDLENAQPPGLIASRFHATVIEAGFKVASWIASRTGLKTVALSGGVFQNEILRTGLAKKLSAGGIRVLLPRSVPVADANLALGQAAIGAAILDKRF